MKYWLMLWLALLPVFANAGEAQDLAKDPAIEKRMIALAQNVRCLVCQNESLAGSHAELAEDLRREIREQMHKGMSDDQILEYLVTRYGDFVLYDPPVKKTTYLLWFGPFLLLVIGAVVLVMGLRKRKQEIVEPTLSEAQLQQASSLLEQDDTNKPSVNSNNQPKESQ